MILLILISLLVLAVISAWWNTQYWKRRGINGPKSNLFIGNLNDLTDMIGNPMPFKLAEWTREYGKVYGFQRGCRNALVLSDQKLAKEVFVDQFENFHERDANPLNGDPDKKAIIHVFGACGLRWKRLRTLTSLVFTTKSLKKIFPIIIDCADKMIQNLDKDLENSPVIDFAQNLKEYTADIILKSAFGQDKNRQQIQETVKGVVESFSQFKSPVFFIAWICPPIAPTLGFINFMLMGMFNKFFANFFRQTFKDIGTKKEARDNQIEKDVEAKDFIDLLVEAESDDVVLQSSDTYDKKNSHIEKRLTTNEIVGTCTVFLIAGFDTTANTLAFTIYHLAVNSKIQDKIRQEIKERHLNEDFDYDTLNQLKYLDAVMKETLRLHPIAAGFTSRRCSKSTKIGGIEIEKNTDIILDVVSMHRNKEIWGEDAEEYKPERWLNSDSQLGDNYGFGSGLRTCVAMRLAQLEHKVILVKLLQKYRICEVPETKEAEQVQGVILGPKSVKVSFEEIR